MGFDLDVDRMDSSRQSVGIGDISDGEFISGYLGRFRDIVKNHGSSKALVMGDKHLTYNELDARSNKFALYLQQTCSSDISFVGIHFKKSFDAIVAILSVLKAGFAYVPIDINFPNLRKYQIVTQAGLKYVVTGKDCSITAFSGEVTLLDFTFLSAMSESNKCEALSGPSSKAISYVLFTSGTTGKPKGVSMPYSALSNLIDWQSKFDVFSRPQNTLQFASFGFDVSFQEIFTTLCSGSTLVIATEEQRTNYKHLAELIDSNSVERTFLPYSVLAGLLSHLVENEFCLKTIISAGEPLYLSVELKGYCEKFGCRLVNHYGPTESHVVTQHLVDVSAFDGDSYMPIGRAIDNVGLFVVDSEKKEVEIGLEGELIITGPCLASGYVNDEERTKEQFIDLLVEKRVVRGYLTGDLVKQDEDGCFHYVRRIDQQIKINGIRVEPKEIENILCSYPFVDRVVVLCEKNGHSYSILAFVRFLGEIQSVSELKSWVEKQIPVHMLPNRYIVVKEFPVTENGKLDTSSLLNLDTSKTLNSNKHEERPHTSIEKIIADTWKDVLKVDSVGLRDGFFELGGSSLLAMKMFSNVEDALGYSYSLSDIFKYPTIQLLLENKPKAKDVDILNDAQFIDKKCYRASFSQLQMWIETEKFGNDYTYNTPILIKIESSLCRKTLERAFRTIIAQHLVLSCIYTFDGEDLYQTPVGASGFELDYQSDVDSSSLPVFVEKAAKHCFKLGEELPVQALYLDVNDGSNALLINIHHIAVDEWSHGILLEQLDVEYSRRLTPETTFPSVVTVLDLRYAEFAEAQRRRYERGGVVDDCQRQLNESVRRLSGNDSDLGFQSGHVLDGAVKKRGKTFHFELPEILSLELVAFAKENSISLYSCMLGVYVILLHRFSGKKDITVGTPISLRDSFDSKNVIGCFLNTIAIRIVIDEQENASSLIKRVSDALSEAVASKDVPFEKIVEAISPRRDSSGGSVFSTMFVMRESYSEELKLFGTQCQVEDVFLDVAKFDLTTFAKFDGRKISLSFEYKTEVFDQSIVEKIGVAFELVVRQISSNSKRFLTDITVSEDSGGPFDLGRLDDVPSPITVHEAFFKQVLTSENSVAIRYLDEEVSYGALLSNANKIASFLHEQGVVKGDAVGLLSSRKVPAFVASMLGILQLGAVYVPLDGNSPSDRIQYIIDDANCRVVLVDESKICDDLKCLSYEFEDALKAENISLEVSVSPDDMASVMYTSGSTGNPKGVMVPHRGITRLVRESNYISVGAHSRCLHLSPAAFDASTLELWLPLLNGGLSIQYPFPELQLEDFGEFLSCHEVDTLWLTSSLFNTVIDTYPESLIPISQLLVGGEPLSVSHINKAIKLLPDTQIINGYGPTENTTFTCCYRIPKGKVIEGTSVPIGRPIQNTSLFILNESCQLLPPGIPGELYVGGRGVALGYLNLEALTEEKFVNNIFSGVGKLYATGDFCRVLPDGNVEFIGRKDGQLKIHGRRIELAEVELVIDQFDGVLQVHVAVTDNSIGHPEIVAFVVLEDSDVDCKTVNNLRSFLAGQLPNYMIPSHIIDVPELFLTLNGKIDRNRLLAEWRAVKGGNQETVAPNKNLSDIEVVVTRLIAKSLGLKDVGIEDDFFELGGNSLLAIKLMSEIYSCVGIRLVLSDFFSSSTIKELIEGSRKDDRAHSPISLLFSETSSGECISVFHNISLAKNVFKALEGNRAVFGLLCGKHSEIVSSFDREQPISVDLEEFVREYYELLIKQRPKGPYIFVGHSYGGLIAFELANYMSSQGRPVESVYLLDTILPSSLKVPKVRAFLNILRDATVRYVKSVISLFHSAAPKDGALLGLYADLLANYRGPDRPYDGKVVLIRSCESVKKICKLPDYGWNQFLSKPLIVEDVEGDHFSIIESDNISPLVSIIERDLSTPSNQTT